MSRAMSSFSSLRGARSGRSAGAARRARISGVCSEAGVFSAAVCSRRSRNLSPPLEGGLVEATAQAVLFEAGQQPFGAGGAHGGLELLAVTLVRIGKPHGDDGKEAFPAGSKAYGALQAMHFAHIDRAEENGDAVLGRRELFTHGMSALAHEAGKFLRISLCRAVFTAV